MKNAILSIFYILTFGSYASMICTFHFPDKIGVLNIFYWSMFIPGYMWIQSALKPDYSILCRAITKPFKERYYMRMMGYYKNKKLHYEVLGLSDKMTECQNKMDGYKQKYIEL